jgi:hypothetical protein
MSQLHFYLWIHRETSSVDILNFPSIKSIHLKECEYKSPPPRRPLGPNICNKTCAHIRKYCYTVLVLHILNFLFHHIYCV